MCLRLTLQSAQVRLIRAVRPVEQWSSFIYPLTFGNVRRIQAEQYGNRLIACDLANPDFVCFAESFGAAAERVKDAPGLRGALRRADNRIAELADASREPMTQISVRHAG